jgi:hypothetical protein
MRAWISNALIIVCLLIIAISMVEVIVPTEIARAVLIGLAFVIIVLILLH